VGLEFKWASPTLQSELEAALGRSVDVVTEKGLKARIRARVLREVIPF
jgi:uncharacterized protein